MISFKIATIPGDGAGVTVMAEVQRLVAIMNNHMKTQVELTEFPFGGRHFIRHHEAITEEFLKQLSNDYRGVFIGALGDPTIYSQQYVTDIHTKILNRLDLNMGIQPIVLFHQELTQLRGRIPDDINILVFRDQPAILTDESGFTVHPNSVEEVSSDLYMVSHQSIVNYLNVFFSFIDKRYQGDVILVLKKKVFPRSHTLWEKLFKEMVVNYPNLKGTVIDTPRFFRQFLENSRQVRLVLLPGGGSEIVSDLFQELTGGPLIGAKAFVSAKNKFLVEPMHGPLPGHKDHSRVAPFGAFLALSLLYYILDMRTASRIIRETINTAFENNWLTADLGGSMTTEDTGGFMAAYLDKRMRQAAEKESL